MARQVLLTHGYVALVDDEDHGLVSQFRWVPLVHPDGRVYARTRNKGEIYRPEWPVYIRMHRLIMGFPASGVDHVNGDGLDNRRSNLRCATHAQNNANSRRQVGKAFKGVSFRTTKGKWQARLRNNYAYESLGYYATAEEAARAYDARALELWGDFARLNYP